MKVLLTIVLVVHGLIHLMAFAKAFGFAKVAGLHLPVSRAQGVAWLLACVAMLITAALLWAPGRFWPIAGFIAVLISQALIFSAWSDARAGTIANAVVLLVVALGAWELRPGSFRSTYEREVKARVATVAAAAPVTEAELDRLPPLLATYLRRVGVVGRPHVRDYRVRWKGEIRSGPTARWMPFVADQHNFTQPPERYFLMEATMFGVPVEAFHRFATGQSTMQVRAASLFEVADAKGPKMNQSESVTLFNDMCVLAPATLLDAPIQWRTTGARTVEGCFSHLADRVCAELFFDESGDLSDFVSLDRFASVDGVTATTYPWQTPLTRYRQFGPARIASHGDARWQEPAGTWTYGRFDLVELEYDP